MKSMIVFALLLVLGKALAGEQLIDVQHDSTRGVTCWILNNTGISYLPDSSLRQTPASTIDHESQAARASLATSMRQNEQLPAAPRPPERGFQL